MPTNNDYYQTYLDGDSLNPGDTIKIEHTIFAVPEKADISELVLLPQSELDRRREESVKLENSIFEQLRAATVKWEEQAAVTMLIDRAIDYCKVPACQHSNNQWTVDEHANNCRSNMVYSMFWHVYEDTRYDRTIEKSVPVAWVVTWSVTTNRHIHPNGCYIGGTKIAGQKGKRFTDKAAAEEYLKGRIEAYAHLFTEISPPVPQELADCFKINGVLLPGYTVDGKSEEQTKCDAPAEKQSVLGTIAKTRAKQQAESIEDTNASGRKRKRSTGHEH